MSRATSSSPVAILLGLVRQDDQAVFRAAVRLPNLERSLRIVGLATTASAIIDLANVKVPDIIVIDADVLELDAIAVARELIGRGSHAAIILVSDEESPEKIGEAMKAGVEEYFIRPLDPRAIAKQLIEIAEVVEKRRARRLYEAYEAPREEVLPPRHKVIALTAAKGGVGKSTLAANLAIALAQEANAKVALVDLHIGDCAVLLNAMPKLSLQQLPDDLSEIDSAFLNPYTAMHESGVSVFVLVTDVRQGLPIPLSFEKAERFIEILKGEYDFIVLDAPAMAYSTDLVLFSLADLVILVTVPWDVLSLRVTAALVESLRKIYDLNERVHLVLNRAQQKVTTELPDSKIEERLEMKIWERIPNATSIVIASINKGEPFVISQPDSDISRAVRRLARKIAGLPVHAERQRKFLFF